MKSTEYGIRFWKLPTFLGGGFSDKVFKPGEIAIQYPIISEVYTIDAGVKDITWGERNFQHQKLLSSDFVLTRAFDGNEVALSVTVSYKVKADSQNLKYFLNYVAKDDKEVETIITAAARADIRTYMNELKTSEFINKETRYQAVDKVKQSLSKRLEPYGIEILRVNLDDFKFWRLVHKGNKLVVDTTYDDMLKTIQQKREETEREHARIETVREQKEKELQQAIAKMNQILEEAKGYKQQAIKRGDAYYQAKLNEALGVIAKGEAEVKGILAKVKALSVPGSENILKLEIVKKILIANPKFILVNSSGNGEMSLKKLDINELVKDVGLIELIKDKDKKTIK